MNLKKSIVFSIIIGALCISIAIGLLWFDGGVKEVKQNITFDMGTYTVKVDKGNTNAQLEKDMYLRIHIILDLPSDESLQSIKDHEFILKDMINTYLFEINNSDLKNNFITLKIKEDISLRINRIIHPYMVNNILLKEFLYH
ncbi:MAG: flagellar basal body-associated FliL family protein [Anaplasmataceae bacterium]|nr:flagellar basal body-associated FliL family protein [Anaplasmataceae bacterium]